MWDASELSQIQQGVINLLSDIEENQGNVTEYYASAYADVIPGLPIVPPFPEFPELTKAQDAFEQASVIKLQIAAFQNGPRGPYLEAKELAYLNGKTAECDARLSQIANWLKQFKQDSTLMARSWPDISLNLPDLIFYASLPIAASGPRGIPYGLPVFVGGGSEVGAVRWDIQYDPSNAHHLEAIAARDAVWPSLNNIRELDTTEKFDQKRAENGSLQRWYEAFDFWISQADFLKWKEVHHAWLLDKAGNRISYAKNREGRYVVPEVNVGLAAEPWPGPDADLTYKTLEAGDYGSFQQILKPIDGVTFLAGQPIDVDARWWRGSGNPQVLFLLDGARVPGGAISPGAGSTPDEPHYQYSLQNVDPGEHTLDIIAAAADPVGFKLAPVKFKVSAPQISPTITLQPQSIAVVAGKTVTLSVNATGSEPLRYTWYKNGVELFDNARIRGSASKTLSIASVNDMDEADYTVVADNGAGAATSEVALLTITPASYAIAVSSSPAGGGSVSGAGSFTAGSSVTVTATPTSGYKFVNWTESGNVVSTAVSYAFIVDGDRNLIGNFAVLTYTIGASAGAHGTVDPGGSLSAKFGSSIAFTAAPSAGYEVDRWLLDGEVAQTGGNTYTLSNINASHTVQAAFSLIPALLEYQPADLNKDWRLVLGEAIGYAAAYRKGQSWPAAPANIPLGYAVSALSLYKRGELYHVDASKGKAPDWWVGGLSGQSLRVAAASLHASAAQTALRKLPASYSPGSAFTVEIKVTVDAGTFAYGIEDQPPMGWTVSAINESGEFDAINGKVKWTFLDHNSRTLTYQVTPPSNAAGAGAFSGMANFDGSIEIQIAGDGAVEPIPTGSGTAIRKLPEKYSPGSAVSVAITVTVDANTFAYGVEDQPPTGWTVSAINESGEFDSVNGKVKWTFLDHNSRALTYTATPPSNAEGVAGFSGRANFDGTTEIVISGDQTIMAEAVQTAIMLNAPLLYMGFKIDAAAGKTYRVEYAEELNATTWTPAGTITLTSPGQIFVDVTGPAQKKRFYRAVLVP